MSRYVTSRALRLQPFICTRCCLHQVIDAVPRRAFSSSRNTRRGADSNLLEVLESRGLVNQIAGDRNALKRLLQKKRLSFYAGIDPTATSLHLGHLLPLMVLFWSALHGHTAVSLVGGATARVGDPSGRLTSRQSTAGDVQRKNFESMFKQVGSLWETSLLYAQRHGYTERETGEHRLLDNAQWLDKLNVLDFLKMLGNGMRLGTMLGRDT